MRPAAELLDECARLGIALSADGNTLRYRPRAAMPAALLAALTESKADLLAVLRDREGGRRAPWPVRIDDLIVAGRSLNRAGESADRARARQIVADLSAYVASLPPAEQAEMAKRLVAALAS